MEDLKKWIGRKFLDFCKSDPDDEREIHYEMMTGDLSEKLEFTSREIVSMKTMEQIRKSIIRDADDGRFHRTCERKNGQRAKKAHRGKKEAQRGIMGE